MAEPTGFEPATSDVTGRRSNQLNYDSAKKLFQSSISDLRSFIESAIPNPKSQIRNHYWWARRDSNPQPLPCKGSRLPLTYVPAFQKSFGTTALRRSVIVRKGVIAVKEAPRSRLR